MKKRILFALLTIIIVISALIGCNSKQEEDEYSCLLIEDDSPGLYLAQTIDDLIGAVNKANLGETIIESGDDVTSFLMYNNYHADYSECKKIEILIPKLKTEDYELLEIGSFKDHYLYLYTHKEYPSSAIDISLAITKYKNDSNFKGYNYCEYTCNIQGYIVQVYFHYDTPDAETYINDIFTFETQVLRECDVCKSGAAE